MQARTVTLLAFFGFTLITGLNFVGVRLSNRELEPFWGAALRFTCAGALFLILALAMRRRFPRGKALLGPLAFGALGIGVSYAFAYYALVRAPAALAAVAIALAPLMTLFLATAHGLEKVRVRGLLGGLVALGGIAVIFWDQISAAVPLLTLAALIGMAFTISESTVLIKRAPQVDPLVMNALAMLLGAALLALLSRATGERWALPRRSEARIAVGYLVIVGSLVMFFLYLYVLARWDASAIAYQTVLSPIVTVIAATFLAGESVGWLVLVGAAFVLAGVYFGVIRAPRPSPSPSPSPASRGP